MKRVGWFHLSDFVTGSSMGAVRWDGNKFYVFITANYHAGFQLHMSDYMARLSLGGPLDEPVFFVKGSDGDLRALLLGSSWLYSLRTPSIFE
jgi:hypothetical protein